MNLSPLQPISDELLSAYVDGDVTEEEKQQIEFAIANDPDVAWQIQTLRQTVDLLHSLPPIPLPRSFTLEESQVADILAERRGHQTNPRVGTTPSFWQQVLGFFNSGNLALRNASAIAAVLFLILMVGEVVTFPGQVAEQASVAVMESAPAADSEQTMASEVALAPTEVGPVPAEAPAAKDAPSEPEQAVEMSAAMSAPVLDEAPADEAPEASMARMQSSELEESAAPDPSLRTESADTGPAMSSMSAPVVEDATDTLPEGATVAPFASSAEDPSAARVMEYSAPASAEGEESAVEVYAEETPAEEVEPVAVPAAETASMTESAMVVEAVPAEMQDVAGAGPETVPSPPAAWNLWQALQVTLLSLALILLLLWLGSRRRGARK